MSDKETRLTEMFCEGVVEGMFRRGYDFSLKHGKNGGCIVEFQASENEFLIQYAKENAVHEAIVDAAYALMFDKNDGNI